MARRGDGPQVSEAGPDPVQARRERIGGWASAGRRLGFSLFGLAVAVFAFGAVAGFSPAVVTVVVAALAAGSVVLAPAIVVGYGVRAAAREERVSPPADRR